MRITLALSALLVISACGSEAGSDGSEQAAIDETTTTIDAEVPAVAVPLPLDLQLPPESYLLDENFLEYDVNGKTETSFAFGSKSNPTEIMTFYRDALSEAGFTITHDQDYETTASLHAERENGDVFKLASAASGSGVADGESQSSIRAQAGE